MAEVFKAKSFGVEGFERIVAVKRILPTLVEDHEFTTMFIDEARIAANLNHQNIVQIYELQKHAGLFFISMEYIAGRDLRQIMDNQANQGDASRNISRACYIATQVLEALRYAHSKRDPAGRELKIVHRDVTPQNIMISYEGEVKLCDFGIAKAATRAGRTQVGVLKGKFAYMPPEQVRGEVTDHRADLFSLGVVFYEMLTGHRLFVGASDYATLEACREAVVPPARDFNPQIAPELEAIVRKLLARDLQDRYARAADALEALADHATGAEAPYHRRHLREWMQATWVREIESENASLERFMAMTHPTRASLVADLADATLEQDALRITPPLPDTGAHLAPEPPVVAGTFPSLVSPAAPFTADRRVGTGQGHGAPSADRRSGGLAPVLVDNTSDRLVVPAGDSGPGAFERGDLTEHEGAPDYRLVDDASGFDEHDATLRNAGIDVDQPGDARVRLLAYLERGRSAGPDAPPRSPRPQDPLDTLDLSEPQDPADTLDPNSLPSFGSGPPYADAGLEVDETAMRPALPTVDLGAQTIPLSNRVPRVDTPRGRVLRHDSAADVEGTVEDQPIFRGATRRPASFGAEPEDVFAADEPSGDRADPPTDAPDVKATRLSDTASLYGRSPPSVFGSRWNEPPREPAALASTRSMPTDPRSSISERPKEPRRFGQPRNLVLVAGGIALLTAVMIAGALLLSRPRLASLLIRTEPQVPLILRVNGRPVADRTPFEVRDLTVGPHRIELDAPGYAPYVQTIQIGKAKPHTMVVPLVPLPSGAPAKRRDEPVADPGGRGQGRKKGRNRTRNEGRSLGVE